MRKYIILLLFVFLFSGCAGFNRMQDPEFNAAEKMIQEKRYNEALAAYDRMAKQSGGTDRGAYALLSAAKLRSAYDNPHKDYARALQEFDEFVRKYPKNENVADANTWRSFIKIIIELKKENEQLNLNIDQLKRVDIRHEERRGSKNKRIVQPQSAVEK